MFSYNVAYLAAKQGVKLDLVAAAANPLDLLSRTLRQSELGRLAHANHIRPSSIQDLSLPSLDYEQLAQILEPNNAAADSYKRGTSKLSKNDSEKKDAARQITARSSKQPAILEQSYIDAGEAAASVLDIKDPSSLIRKPSSQPSSAQKALRTTAKDAGTTTSKLSSRSEAVSSVQKQRVAVDTRGAAANQPPPSLDFLRQRGRDATKAKSSTSKTESLASATISKASPAKVGPGAVIFNGVEVGVGNVSSSDAARGPTKRPPKQSAEEGWDLV
uniref:Uncharacterized protein n=2 Tax=Kalmanozyma brasiliensis (strain GHG001) TaxID=1365824 RepID=V5GQC9_KALBG